VSALCLSSPPNTTAEATERDGLFVGQYILQVPFGFNKGQLPDGKRSLPSVL